MATFDAVAIEHSLASFFGKQIGAREEFYDADTFRTGRPKNLAVIVRRVAEHLEEKVASIQFNDTSPGGARAQVLESISRLRSLADRIKERKNDEPEDYHWEVFGALVTAIQGLLEQLET